MSDLRIDDATRDLSIGGSELIPVSDGGSPKSVSTGDLAAFARGGMSSSSSAGYDAVADIYVNSGGVLKKISLADLCNGLFGDLFGGTAATSLSATDRFAVKSGSAYVPVTLSTLKSLFKNLIDFASISSGTALSGSENFLVHQGGGPAKVTPALVRDYALSGLAQYISGLASGTPADAAKICVVVDGAAKYVTVSQLVSLVNAVKAPSATTTAANIPQWDSESGKLKDGGLSVTDEIAAAGSTSDTKLPNETAVREAIEDVREAIPDVDSFLTASSPASGSLAAFSSANVLQNGPSVRTSVRAASSASDAALPTEKAVRTLVDSVSSAFDSLRLDTIGAPTDTAVNDATVAAHGLLPKLSGDSDDVLHGDGNWGPVDVPGSLASTQYETIWIPASAMGAATFADASNRRRVIDLSYQSDTYFGFDVPVPANAIGDQVKLRLLWKLKSGYNDQDIRVGQKVGFYVRSKFLADGSLDAFDSSAQSIEDEILSPFLGLRITSPIALNADGGFIRDALFGVQVYRDADYGGSSKVPWNILLVGAQLQFAVSGTKEAW